MSLPLDGDGYLRRECPTCEREFKWLSSHDDDGEPAPVGGYYCPYCRVQAPPESWFTQAQVELATNTVMTDIVGPEFARLGRNLRSSSQRSGGLLKFDARADLPARLDPLVEADDMRRVDFACHPTEPIKVLADWDRIVYCLICSESATDA